MFYPYLGAACPVLALDKSSSTQEHPSVVNDYCVLAMSQGTELQEVCEESRSKRPQFTGFCGLLLLVGRSRVKSFRGRTVMVANTIQAATRRMPVEALIPRAPPCSYSGVISSVLRSVALLHCAKACKVYFA